MRVELYEVLKEWRLGPLGDRHSPDRILLLHVAITM